MPFRRFSPLFLTIVLAGASAPAQDSPTPMSKETREEIIHAFNYELAYVRTNFPMGNTGLKLHDGQLTPSGEELQRLLSLWGPSAKPGDQIRITQVLFKGTHIHFEINGGPIKKSKWYQRIEISGSGGSTPVAPSDANANARGSFVDLYFDKFIPEMTGPDLKKLLWPVFDFESKSPLEAYLESVPPKIRDAIKNHDVLVGMNRDMVLYAKGHPPKKVREHDGEVEYEEWIYGDPPHDVDFVRLVGDEVVRVETMKVDGQKVIRTEKEVDLGEAVAKKQPEERPPNAPTLRRPGEDVPNDQTGDDGKSPTGPPRKTDPGGNPGPPNWTGLTSGT